MEEYAVEVENVSMRFQLHTERVDSMKDFFIRFFQRRLQFEEFWALKDVSFRVKKGGMFGLVGFNGAGKSTMLKLIAGVLKPTQGQVEIHGTIAPLIELGAGFDDELTAHDNVYLNGAVLGYSQQVMRACYHEIIDFSELADFQHVQLKNFSSGMRVRLAFAVATMVRPDILIADEILAVGDHRFQQKCLDRIQLMMRQGTTILLVSHALEHIRNYCTEAIWLDRGRVRHHGPAVEVCERYTEI